jgi:hypothetical protein
VLRPVLSKGSLEQATLKLFAAPDLTLSPGRRVSGGYPRLTERFLVEQGVEAES